MLAAPNDSRFCRTLPCGNISSRADRIRAFPPLRGNFKLCDRDHIRPL